MIRELIEASLDTSRGKREVRWGPISSREAEAVKAIHGLEIAGYEHSIDKSAVNHILGVHGPGRETRKGHVPVTCEDILRIPQILATADSIVDGQSHNPDTPAIRYGKREKDVIFFVAEVRTGKKNRTLAAVTMWKVATGAKDFPGVAAERPHTPEATPVRPLPLSGIIGDAPREDQPGA